MKLYLLHVSHNWNSLHKCFKGNTHFLSLTWHLFSWLGLFKLSSSSFHGWGCLSSLLAFKEVFCRWRLLIKLLEDYSSIIEWTICIIDIRVHNIYIIESRAFTLDICIRHFPYIYSTSSTFTASTIFFLSWTKHIRKGWRSSS